MGVEGRENDAQASNLRMVREEMGAVLGASQEGPRFRYSAKTVVVVSSFGCFWKHISWLRDTQAGVIVFRAMHLCQGDGGRGGQECLLAMSSTRIGVYDLPIGALILSASGQRVTTDIILRE